MAAQIDLETKIDQTIEEVENSYSRLEESIKQQKSTFLNTLNLLKKWVKCIKTKTILLGQAIDDIKRNIGLAEATVEASHFENELLRMRKILEGRDLTFEWRTDIERNVNFVGLLLCKNTELDILEIVKLKPEERYIGVASCKKGPEQGNLIYPEGVTVDPVRGLILVANFGNNSIDIFSSSKKLKSRFGAENGIELSGPNGIKTFMEEIYVSNLHSNCISVHSFAGGRVLRRVGRKGEGELEFSSPEGIALRINGNSCIIYVADRENNRVQVMYGDLSFKRIIGKGYLKEPRDVAEFNQEIYVLDGGFDACIKVFNEAGHNLKQFLRQGEGEGVYRPRYFAIDFTGNLYISNKGRCCITTCNSEGVITGRIGKKGEDIGEFKMPTGIAISIEGKIVIVDGCKMKNVLQILEDVIFTELWK